MCKNNIKFSVQLLHKVSILVISTICLAQSPLLSAQDQDTLIYAYDSFDVSQIKSELSLTSVDPKTRLVYLQYNFPAPGEISPSSMNSLVDKEGKSIRQKSQKISDTERVKRVNSWAAAMNLVAKVATQSIPGAQLLRVVSTLENYALSNRLSVSTMSVGDWAIAAVPPFTLVALQGALRNSFAKIRDLNGARIFMKHNNNLYACYVYLRYGSELIPKLNSPYPYVKSNQLASVSLREAPLYSELLCNNRITQFTKEIPNANAVSQATYKDIGKLLTLNKKSEVGIAWPKSDSIQETLSAPSYTTSLKRNAKVSLSQVQSVMSPEDYIDLRSKIKFFSISSLNVY